MSKPPVPVIVACWLALLALAVPILQEPNLSPVFVASSGIAIAAIALHGYGSIVSHAWSARWGLRIGSFAWFVAIVGLLTGIPFGVALGWPETGKILAGLALGIFLAAEAPRWRD